MKTRTLIEKLHLGEQTPENVAEDVRTALNRMAALLDGGHAVLTAGKLHPDLPAIHEVGPGRTVDTPEVRHLGFGTFKGGDYTFRGGGAMTRSGPISWTTLSGPDPDSVYDFQAAKAAVAELQEAAEGLDSYRDRLMSQAYSDAVAAILTADSSLAPAYVLRALDYDGESLGLSGPHAQEILRRVGHEAINEAERLFFARLE